MDRFIRGCVQCRGVHFASGLPTCRAHGSAGAWAIVDTTSGAVVGLGYPDKPGVLFHGTDEEMAPPVAARVLTAEGAGAVVRARPRVPAGPRVLQTPAHIRARRTAEYWRKKREAAIRAAAALHRRAA